MRQFHDSVNNAVGKATAASDLRVPTVLRGLLTTNRKEPLNSLNKPLHSTEAFKVGERQLRDMTQVAAASTKSSASRSNRLLEAGFVTRWVDECWVQSPAEDLTYDRDGLEGHVEVKKLEAEVPLWLWERSLT